MWVKANNGVVIWNTNCESLQVIFRVAVVFSSKIKKQEFTYSPFMRPQCRWLSGHLLNNKGERYNRNTGYKHS